MGRTHRQTDRPVEGAGAHAVPAPPGGEVRRAAADHDAGAIITIDGDQRILSLSTEAERILGYRAVDVLGQPLDRLLPGRFADAGRRADGTEGPAQEPIPATRRTSAEVRRLALEINDEVVQGLVMAQSVLALGWGEERALEVVNRTLATARRLVSALLGEGPVGSGELVRAGPADSSPGAP